MLLTSVVDNEVRQSDQRHLALRRHAVRNLDAAEIETHHQRRDQRELDGGDAAGVADKAVRSEAARLAGHYQPARIARSGLQGLIGKEHQRCFENGEGEREERQRHKRELDRHRAVLLTHKPPKAAAYDFACAINKRKLRD
jgi:hypothetical protein